MKTYAEKRFFKWELDDVSVSLRAKSGSYGGGSEVLIIEKHVSEIRIHEDICPTLGERLGTGGGNFPMVVEVKDEDSNGACVNRAERRKN